MIRGEKMNQILYVGDNKNNGPVAVKSVIKFFAIVIIIFGIILIGEGTYSMYKGIVANSGNNIPTVYMNRVNDTVVIKAENNIEIAKLIYSWNKGEETVLLPNNKAVEEVVLLPNENSILNVTIVDIKGKETKFMQQWNIEGIDIKKPEMEIATDDSSRKITIIARDETQIDYLIYKWNNEAETRVNGTERNKLEIQKTIDMKLGENKLTVTAVDKKRRSIFAGNGAELPDSPRPKLLPARQATADYRTESSWRQKSEPGKKLNTHAVRTGQDMRNDPPQSDGAPTARRRHARPTSTSRAIVSPRVMGASDPPAGRSARKSNRDRASSRREPSSRLPGTGRRTLPARDRPPGRAVAG